MLAVDTETTGLDIHHGCRPYFVSTCSEQGELTCWEWDVDPLTRLPIISPKEVAEVTSHLKGQELVFHNSKFDVRALTSIGVKGLNWDNIHDTHIASHALHSGGSHKLKDLALLYCNIPDDDQATLQKSVNECRRLVKTKKLNWRIAQPRDPHFPGLKRTPKGGMWPLDGWLPRAIAKKLKYDPSHRFWNVNRIYGLRDVERTMALWWVLKEGLETEGLWEQYETRRKLLEVTCDMENRGVTVSVPRLTPTTSKYRSSYNRVVERAKLLANNRIDNLNSPKQLQRVLFQDFKLQPAKFGKSGPSTDKDVLKELLLEVPHRSKAAGFITSLQQSRKLKTSLQYLDSYTVLGMATEYKDFLQLHPNYNICGTDTTRLSSNDPNQQNVSKQEDFNLREVFGPLPDREWYTADYENIEMRIPAFMAGEKELIELFESGGSWHLLVCSVLHPQLFAECERDGVGFKERYKSTWYQWVKNGNFAIQYGAMQKTADHAYHVSGAWEALRSRFPKITKYNDYWVDHAQRKGYVTTLGGYRLYCPFQYGKVIPTTPLNYHVQGSAGWAMVKAMYRVNQYLKGLNAKGGDHHLIMTIHDELDFDFPLANKATPKGNTPVIKQVKRLMEMSGYDLGLPTPVDIKRIPTSWAHEESIAV